MRLIIAGSRDLTDLALLRVIEREVELLPSAPSLVLSGGCRGVDRLGERWARARGVPIELHAPDWSRYGRAAGPRRNAAMVARADALVVLRLPRSRGSLDVLRRARTARLLVHDVVIAESSSADGSGHPHQPPLPGF